MAQAKGYKSKLLLDFETTFGSDPGTPAGLLMPVNSCSVKSQRSKNTAQTITGSRNPVAPFDGNTSVRGSVVVPLDSTAFWYWLKAMFGAPSTSGSDPYDHEFTVGDTQPSLVLEKQYATDTASYAKMNGCKVGSLAMSFGGDGELTAEMQVEGASEALSTSAYDGSASAVSISRLNNFQASIKEGGSTMANCVSCDLSIDFGLDTDQYVIGSDGVRGDIPEGLLAVTGKVVALFEDLALLNKAVNSTESSLEITVSAGASSALVIAINELQFERNSPGIEGPKGIRIELPFVGYYDDDADASAVIFTLTNGDAHA